MNPIIYLLIGLVVGYLIGKMQKGQGQPATGIENNATNQARMEERQRHLDQIMRYLDSHNQITNDEVQAVLKVSDPTAERYLNELEHEGKITQIGRTGRNVIYKKA